ncbi:hypothetical protein O6V14_04590 [Sphingomonas faeni]|uniref:hypothetical protein n=1 Tax=Sphingomonas faeni TaxID=185950 RepID=UPI003360A7D0
MTPETISLAPGDTASVAMLPDGGGMVTITRAEPVAVKPTPPVPRASLFSAQSMWNARPVNPVLGKDAIPAQTPWIEEGAYGSKIFRAKAGDGPATVTVADIANQLDGGTVTIPKFPAATMPATGQDGHCEILDGDTLHSFFQLRQTSGKWAAQKYARTSATGSGWGTVSNPDNARAAGCSTAGGLLLASERGLDVIPHALAIGVDKNALLMAPIFPATLQDIAGGYTGKFPMGALLMLPASFNVDALVTPQCKAIARTLKTFGGYIVDATVGSMNIYAEIGSGWNSSPKDAADLVAIKTALRRVTSQDGWKDRDGKPFTPTPHRSMNLLSMRGPWEGYSGSKAFGCYDAASDLLQAEATTDARTIRQLLWMHDEANRFEWKQQKWNLNPEPGVEYIVTAFGMGAITATLATSVNWKRTSSTPKLAPGQSASFTWPTDPATVAEVFVDKPAGGAASIRLELVKA